MVYIRFCKFCKSCIILYILPTQGTYGTAHISVSILLVTLFSNGLAPDNLFFQGVAANCVKIQLSHLGLETEFAQCNIEIDEKDWDGVRRKYWHGRNTYYLPIATWKK
jgi:hypothetical protein